MSFLIWGCCGIINIVVLVMVDYILKKLNEPRPCTEEVWLLTLFIFGILGLIGTVFLIIVMIWVFLSLGWRNLNE